MDEISDDRYEEMEGKIHNLLETYGMESMLLVVSDLMREQSYLARDGNEKEKAKWWRFRSLEVDDIRMEFGIRKKQEIER